LLSSKHQNGTFDFPTDAVVNSCPDECKPVTCGVCAHRHCADACQECVECWPEKRNELKCGPADVCFDLEHCSPSYQGDACGGCQMCCAAECSRAEVMYGSAIACGMGNCRRCSFCPVEATTTTTTTTVTIKSQECPHMCEDAVSSGWQDWGYVCTSFKAQCWMCNNCLETGETNESNDDYCTVNCAAEDGPSGPKQSTICEWSAERCQNCKQCGFYRSINHAEGKDNCNYVCPSMKVLLVALLASLGLRSG